ncbi:MAG: hypothetical protein ACE5HD_11175 [Acidobacteriota bacterium]
MKRISRGGAEGKRWGRLRGMSGLWGSGIPAGAVVIGLGLAGLAHGVPAAARPMPDSTDQALLLVVEAVLEGAARGPAPWPGYDAAARPLLVYRVGRWSLLLNPSTPDPVEGWIRYPASWPPLSRPAWLDLDGDPNLVGQLFFDYEVPGGRVVE